MNNGSKTKIVFFAYHSTTLLRQYWQCLKDKADCQWVTFSSLIYDELRRSGYPNIVFKDIRGGEFKPTILCKLVKRIRFYFSKYIYPRLIKKTLDEIDADIIISNVTFPLLGYASRAMKVQAFHSVSYKRYILAPETLEYDLVLLPGESYKETMCRRFSVKDPDKLRVVGWPRIDDFVNKRFTMEDRNIFMKKLGLNPTLKNVLYAPTWSSFYKRHMFPKSFGKITDAFEEFCRSLKQFNINLIIRLHSINSKSAADRRLHRIAEKYDVCFFKGLQSEYFDNNVKHFLWSADVLISDASGIITDYLTLNRPIVYIEPDSKRLISEDWDLPKEFRAGAVISSMEQLTAGVKRALDYPDEYELKRKEAVQKIFYKMDGNSSQRAAETVLDYYHNKFNSQDLGKRYA